MKAIPLTLLVASLPVVAASYVEGDFGFDAAAADNAAAWASLTSHFASGGDGDTVTFTNGVYKTVMSSGSALTVTNRDNWTISAPGAVFQDTTTVNYGRAFFKLYSCSNVTLSFKARGAMYGDETTNAVTGAWFVASNQNCNVSVISTQLYYVVKAGEYDNRLSGGELYTGNEGINVIGTNYDSRYGIAYYLTSDSTVSNYSIGSAAAGYAAHRSVYLAGCTNITATSWAQDMNIQHSFNLITTAPHPGGHAPSKDITLTATDLGTTYYQPFQRLAVIQTQSSLWQDTNTVQTNFTLNLFATSSGATWSNRVLCAFNGYPSGSGVQAEHKILGVTISGIYNRTNDATVSPLPAIFEEAYSTNLHTLQVNLENFHDLAVGSPDTIQIYGGGAGPITNTIATFTACSSTVNGVSLPNPLIQTFTYLGTCAEMESFVSDPGITVGTLSLQ